MLSAAYFRYRWSWYKPILDRGEAPADRCRVDVRRLPLRMPGEDAGERVPYALHSELERMFTGAVWRLQNYLERYMIEGVRISAHQLPRPDETGRELIRHLRRQCPHLPPHLLHHWCADSQGGAGLLKTLNGLWAQAWEQDQADVAPWAQAVNVLMLSLLRRAIGRLPDDHPRQTDQVMLGVVGGMYLWSLQRFLKQMVEGALEVTRIAAYEAMIVPVTPMAFLHRQPEDALLGDARHVIAAYGLEPDLIPRLRELRARAGGRNEAGILALLARDKLGDHLLKRSWARLSLRELAARTGQGGWMQWALDPKKLDAMLTRPQQACAGLAESLASLREYPFADWLLDAIAGGGKYRRAGPWRHDDVTLNAFRVFDEDLKVEVARRREERRWMDRRAIVAGSLREASADPLLEKAWREGKIVFLQPDFSRALHGGKRLSGRQACLRIEWSDWLAGMAVLLGPDMQPFLHHFADDVMKLLEMRKDVFVDDFSAAGCLLRGAASSLFDAGVALRRWMRARFSEHLPAGDETLAPATPMCLAMTGEWHVAELRQGSLGRRRLAFSLGVTQAIAGVGRDGGMDRLMARRKDRPNMRPLGDVWVTDMDAGEGDRVRLLCNHGFAVTLPALTALIGDIRSRAAVREYRIGRAEAGRVLRGFQLPEGMLDLIVIQADGDERPLFIVWVGKASLAGVEMDLYEVLEPDSEAARRIESEGLAQWAHR